MHPANENKPVGKSRTRPVDLPLHKIRLSASGVVSIIHRVTGVLLIIAIPLLILGLQVSLSGPAGFRQVEWAVTSVPGRIVWVSLILILAQHFFSGLRHLLLDVDIGMGRSQSRRSAWATAVATGTVAVVLCIGIFI